MFKIQGADQKEYGPVTAEVMRQWIAERRVDGRTQVQAEGTTAWKPLSEFPEFAASLTGVRPAPATPLPLPAAAPLGPVRNSGMAVASLVLGILGCLGLTALLGIVFGVISLIQISKSQGRLKGTGMAIAGLCLSGFMLFLGLPIAAGLLLPALAKAKSRAQTINCISNLKQLALGCRMYANDNKDVFPGAATWCDDINQYLGPKVFHCAADSSGQRGTYALNSRLAGKKVDDVNPSTVLLFEIQGGWNVSGGVDKLMSPSRHHTIVNVAFADGSAAQMRLDRLPTLRWDP